MNIVGLRIAIRDFEILKSSLDDERERDVAFAIIGNLVELVLDLERQFYKAKKYIMPKFIIYLSFFSNIFKQHYNSLLLMSNFRISRTGIYLPEGIVKTSELEKKFNKEEGEFVKSTGILERHISANGDIIDFAAKAGLKVINRDASSIDHLIYVNDGPWRIPNDEQIETLKQNLGLRNIEYDIINEACAGTIFGLKRASELADKYKTILLIASTALTKNKFWYDITAPLFGEAAAAVLLEKTDKLGFKNFITAKHPYPKNPIVTVNSLEELEKYADSIKPDSGKIGEFDFSIYADKQQNVCWMDGQIIFKEAVKQMTKDIKGVLEEAHLTLDDIDFVVPHQANGRITDSVRKNFDKEYKGKFINLIANYGNTSAASILIVRHELQEKINELHTALKIPVRIVYATFGLNEKYFPHGAVIEECYPFEKLFK